MRARTRAIRVPSSFVSDVRSRSFIIASIGVSAPDDRTRALVARLAPSSNDLGALSSCSANFRRSGLPSESCSINCSRESWSEPTSERSVNSPPCSAFPSNSQQRVAICTRGRRKVARSISRCRPRGRKRIRVVVRSNRVLESESGHGHIMRQRG